MNRPSSLHLSDWSGRPSEPETAFLTTLAHLARSDGRRSCLSLADEIEAIGHARLPWKPKNQPVVAHLDACLKRGPSETIYLRGAISDIRRNLTWERAPADPGLLEFARRHAFSTIVGETARIPSDRLRIGLMIIDAHSHYPTHRHAADELYLPVSGIAAMRIGAEPPARWTEGRFLPIPGNAPHALWTGEHAILFVWAWLGDISGPYHTG